MMPAPCPEWKEIRVFSKKRGGQKSWKRINRERVELEEVGGRGWGWGKASQVTVGSADFTKFLWT